MGFDEDMFSTRVAAISGLDDQGFGQFGSKQVIIVRDTDDKTRLGLALGEFALILTIMESKGMEFEDVLLYDFFSTSECTSAFRALSNSKTLDERHIVSVKGLSKE